MDGLFLEAQVVEGLEEIAANEIRRFFSSDLGGGIPVLSSTPGSIQFQFAEIPGWIRDLKTVAAVYLGRRFDIPRPKALLGDENFRILLDQITQAEAYSGTANFRSFFLSAAGRESSLLARLRSEISDATGLSEGDSQGELLIRIRKSSWMAQGWDVLVRLTPRPLSARPWRVCSLEGSLNATVAHAMALLAEPSEQDAVLNIGCGSGSLLIERLASGGARSIAGCDISQEALSCGARNLEAAGMADSVDLLLGDGRRLPFSSGSFDAILADLPFGHRIGSHPENQEVYPYLLSEAARVIRPRGRMAVITHEVRLIQSILANSREWFPKEIYRINLRGLHPRIFILVRKGE